MKKILISSVIFLFNSYLLLVAGQISTEITDGVYKITSKASGFALTVENILLVNGARFYQYTDWDTEFQKFAVKSGPNSQYFLTILHSRKMLSVPDWKTDNGVQMVQWEYNGETDQQWMLVGNGDGYFRIKSVANGKYLQTDGVGEGAPIVQWDLVEDDDKQYFAFEKILQDGVYKISSFYSGKVLGIENSSMDDGGKLIQSFDTDSSSQKFFLKNTGTQDVYHLIALNSRKAINLPDGLSDNDLQMNQMYYDGGVNQQWTITKTQDGYFQIQSVVSSKNLQVDSKDEGAPVTQGRKLGKGSKQKFDLEKVFEVPVRSFNHMAFLCSHNSFTSSGEGWILANQAKTLSEQLEYGIRVFDIDTYYQKADFWAWFRGINDDGTYLLHGLDKGYVAGFSFVIPARKLSEALQEMVDFLQANRREIITVFIEDYAGLQLLINEMNLVVGLNELIYDPDNDLLWSAAEKRAWPLVSDMIEMNKRLLIFVDENYDNPGNKVGLPYDFDYVKQNFWSIGDLGDELTCQSRYGFYGDHSFYKAPPLFFLNHFRDIPVYARSQQDNTYSNLTQRIYNDCLPQSGQLPNFLAVDFVDFPRQDFKDSFSISDPWQVVHDLNKRGLLG